jgi:hypothetical protein
MPSLSTVDMDSLDLTFAGIALASLPILAASTMGMARLGLAFVVAMV